MINIILALGRNKQAIVDSLLWYSYLALLISVSFLNEVFPSQSWFLFATALFCLSALFSLNALFGGRCNWPGLVSALPALLIMFFILVLLTMQVTLPSLGSAESLLSGAQGSVQPPAWFSPDLRWSIVPKKTLMLFSSELILAVAFVLSIVVVCTRRRVVQLLVVIMCVGLVHALVSVVAKYGGLTLVDIKQLDGHYTAARAWFVNRNHFAAFISLTMFAALALQLKILILNEGNRFSSVVLGQLLSYRVFFVVAIAFSLIAIILSQSRAGFLALLIALVFVFVGLGKNAQKFGKRRRVLIPTILICVLALSYFGVEMIARFSPENSFLGERVAQWAVTMKAINSAWLTGYGGNSYVDVFQIVRGYSDFRPVLFNQAHNDYLHIWLEQGLIGLALWLALMFVTLHRVYSAFITSSSSLVNACMLAIGVVIIAALIQSTVDFNLQILNIRYYFFVIMSLAFSIPAIRQRKGRPTHSVLI